MNSSAKALATLADMSGSALEKDTVAIRVLRGKSAAILPCSSAITCFAALLLRSCAWAGGAISIAA